MQRRLTFDATPKLLAERHSGTTEIGLFWSRRRHRAAVAVEDLATGERFELDVAPGENAIELFEHPFSYADSRRVRAP